MAAVRHSECRDAHPPHRCDVTMTVDKDGCHLPVPAEFAVTAGQAALAQAASIAHIDSLTCENVALYGRVAVGPRARRADLESTQHSAVAGLSPELWPPGNHPLRVCGLRALRFGEFGELFTRHV